MQKASKNFELIFRRWLKSSLINPIPESVKAFSFNLYMSTGYHGTIATVELIGAENFDSDNEDWACGEIWEPSQRQLDIPQSFSTDNWEICQENMKILILKCLSQENRYFDILKQREAIGLGFVDGNLDLLWCRFQK